jgi:hypothetical protein
VGKNCPMVLLYGNVSGAQGHVRGQNASGSSISTLMVCTQFAKKPCLCPLCLFFHKTPRTPNFSQAHQKSRRTLSEEQSCWEGQLPSGRSVVAKSHRRPHREEPPLTETLAMEPPLPLFCPSGGSLIALLMTMDSRRVVPPVEAEARAQGSVIPLKLVSRHLHLSLGVVSAERAPPGEAPPEDKVVAEFPPGQAPPDSLEEATYCVDPPDGFHTPRKSQINPTSVSNMS